ncbi:MAG: FecR family protein [Steroidobacteraceae bacterium]
MNEDPIGRALSQAGPRPTAPAELQAQVHRAVERGWQDMLAGQRLRRRRQWLAAAGVLVALGAALGAGWLVHTPGTPAAGAALFVASRGATDVRTRAAGGDATGTATGTVLGGRMLPAGTHVRTGRDGIALLAMGPVMLRIGPDSDALLDSPGQLTLNRGRLYLDSGARPLHGGHVRLHTPLGDVEHLGTQFQVRLEDHQLSVGVREGQVRVSSAAGEQLLGEREGVEVDAQGHARLQAVPAFGPSWDWTQALRPDFPIEGRTLAEFLEWYARETGHPVTFDSAATRAEAQGTRLNGSITGLSPQDALAAVLASTQFVLVSNEDGSLRVTVRPGTHAKLRVDAMPLRAAESGPGP